MGVLSSTSWFIINLFFLVVSRIGRKSTTKCIDILTSSLQNKNLLLKMRSECGGRVCPSTYLIPRIIQWIRTKFDDI
jgi:hypothetical protein